MAGIRVAVLLGEADLEDRQVAHLHDLPAERVHRRGLHVRDLKGFVVEQLNALLDGEVLDVGGAREGVHVVAVVRAVVKPGERHLHLGVGPRHVGRPLLVVVRHPPAGLEREGADGDEVLRGRRGPLAHEGQHPGVALDLAHAPLVAWLQEEGGEPRRLAIFGLGVRVLECVLPDQQDGVCGEGDLVGLLEGGDGGPLLQRQRRLARAGAHEVHDAEDATIPCGVELFYHLVRGDMALVFGLLCVGHGKANERGRTLRDCRSQHILSIGDDQLRYG
mmetsp:Transcript_85823/g.270496  ORF Transcript_85823/g.270496 Transcript_85823/m.270496 type:complete len:276 (-) Transcript_85823:584-1411(-)